MSTIKVNKLEQRSGCTATVGGGAGKTVTVDATTVTLGRCGATVSLASGATAAGFGSTGEVSWNTTKITADPGPAVSGVGYFCDTSAGSFNVTLPGSPSAGAVIAVSDYTGTFGNNSLTIARNGSNINGAANNFVIGKSNVTVQFIYVDATEGWRIVFTGSQTDEGLTEGYLTASGGNAILTCGNFKTHVFTSSGTFTVSALACAPANDVVQYMVVAGGGGAGRSGGGGGAGGWRSYNACSPASPANGPATLPVSVQGYPVTIGAGGPGGDSDSTTQPGTTGSPSTFSTITSAGGGGGGNYNTSGGARPGGSGGGGGAGSATGGTGNDPPVTPAQGTNGGNSTRGSPNLGQRGFGGGGGEVDAGTAGSYPNTGGQGGDGTFVPTGWFGPTAPSYGTPGPVAGRFFGGGGAGAACTSINVDGGVGGGGRGSSGPPAPLAATAGTANTGGGGGAQNNENGLSGGSGVVLIRYRYQ